MTVSPSRSAASLALLVFMAAIYSVQLAMSWAAHREIYGNSGSVLVAVAEAPRQFLSGGAIARGLLERGEWWRLVTAIFLHGGFFHLLYNAWAMLQFGSLLETLYGAPALLMTFLVSGVLASAASSLFLDAQYGVGASGAIFGIVGALVAVMGKIRTRRANVARVLQLQLALWALLTIAGGFLSVAIDNVAHIAGFVAGLLIGALLRRRNQRESSSPLASSSSSARLTGIR